jgi:hypothetical protein
VGESFGNDARLKVASIGKLFTQLGILKLHQLGLNDDKEKGNFREGSRGKRNYPNLGYKVLARVIKKVAFSK